MKAELNESTVLHFTVPKFCVLLERKYVAGDVLYARSLFKRYLRFTSYTNEKLWRHIISLEHRFNFGQDLYLPLIDQALSVFPISTSMFTFCADLLAHTLCRIVRETKTSFIGSITDAPALPGQATVSFFAADSRMANFLLTKLLDLFTSWISNSASLLTLGRNEVIDAAFQKLIDVLDAVKKYNITPDAQYMEAIFCLYLRIRKSLKTYTFILRALPHDSSRVTALIRDAFGFIEESVLSYVALFSQPFGSFDYQKGIQLLEEFTDDVVIFVQFLHSGCLRINNCIPFSVSDILPCMYCPLLRSVSSFFNEHGISRKNSHTQLISLTKIAAKLRTLEEAAARDTDTSLPFNSLCPSIDNAMNRIYELLGESSEFDTNPSARIVDLATKTVGRMRINTVTVISLVSDSCLIFAKALISQEKDNAKIMLRKALTDYLHVLLDIALLNLVFIDHYNSAVDYYASGKLLASPMNPIALSNICEFAFQSLFVSRYVKLDMSYLGGIYRIAESAILDSIRGSRETVEVTSYALLKSLLEYVMQSEGSSAIYSITCSSGLLHAFYQQTALEIAAIDSALSDNCAVNRPACVNDISCSRRMTFSYLHSCDSILRIIADKLMTRQAMRKLDDAALKLMCLVNLVIGIHDSKECTTFIKNSFLQYVTRFPFHPGLQISIFLDTIIPLGHVFSLYKLSRTHFTVSCATNAVRFLNSVSSFYFPSSAVYFCTILHGTFRVLHCVVASINLLLTKSSLTALATDEFFSEMLSFLTRLLEHFVAVSDHMHLDVAKACAILYANYIELVIELFVASSTESLYQYLVALVRILADSLSLARSKLESTNNLAGSLRYFYAVLLFVVFFYFDGTSNVLGPLIAARVLGPPRDVEITANTIPYLTQTFFDDSTDQ